MIRSSIGKPMLSESLALFIAGYNGSFASYFFSDAALGLVDTLQASRTGWKPEKAEVTHILFVE